MGDTYSLSFDGDDDHVELGSITSSDDLCLNSATDLSFWLLFKPESGDTFQRIIDKSTGGSGTDGWALVIEETADEIQFYVDGLEEVSFRLRGINLGEWQSITVVYDDSATNWYLYINGLLQETQPASAFTIPTTTANCAIGSWNHSTAREFEGQINELRVYDVALTQANIEELEYSTDRDNIVQTGLVAAWLFNDGSGTTATDETGNYDGTLTGGPSWVTTLPPIHDFN